MADVDISPMTDALKEVVGVIFAIFFLIIDEMLGRLWEFSIRMLSIDHLGNSPAIVFLTLGLVGCIYIYVMKFWTR